ncbi:MAG: hypothetical protein HQL76_12565 [Magnetococcales bacterium]|nr:hypothetical protein [Magnetococcales bacterium]
MFPKTPAIRCHDPLAELLGAGTEPFTYTFDDAVKLAGHACPTVAGAFLLVKKGLDLLYPDTLPQRGDIAITVPGRVDEGVTGPITQIFTLVTGAAAANGFKGLGSQFKRMDLLRFQPPATPLNPYIFERCSTGRQVRLIYSPQAFPPAPRMESLLPLILGQRASPEQRMEFGQLWRQRVLDILADGGARTIHEFSA